jgi:hypothetical protein
LVRHPSSRQRLGYSACPFVLDMGVQPRIEEAEAIPSLTLRLIKRGIRERQQLAGV